MFLGESMLCLAIPNSACGLIVLEASCSNIVSSSEILLSIFLRLVGVYDPLFAEHDSYTIIRKE
jgi:hypothetical protein